MECYKGLDHCSHGFGLANFVGFFCCGGVCWLLVNLLGSF